VTYKTLGNIDNNQKVGHKAKTVVEIFARQVLIPNQTLPNATKELVYALDPSSQIIFQGICLAEVKETNTFHYLKDNVDCVLTIPREFLTINFQLQLSPNIVQVRFPALYVQNVQDKKLFKKLQRQVFKKIGVDFSCMC
jgi:hypothetical protein